MRADLSDQLIHLTRGTTLDDAEGIFRKILNGRALLGSSTNVRGGYDVICFSEAPVDVLARIFANPTAHGFRYRPFGVMLPKGWLFERGGRPVIYQPEFEYEHLTEPTRYRHVRFDAPGGEKDFTFEREWRIRTDRLELDPAICTLVVPTRDWDYRLRDEHAAQDMRNAAAIGKSPFTRMSNYPWHVLALGDLGTSLAIEDVP